MFCGAGYAEQISHEENWKCFMCTGKAVRILKRRDDWQEKLKLIFEVDTDDIDFVRLDLKQRNSMAEIYLSNSFML